MLEAGSLRKAVIPQSLILDPSPGNLQSTRLALHVDDDGSSCSVYIASGCRVYKIQICMGKSMVTKGKESLLIPVPAQVMQSLMVDRCPHRSEIQSVVLTEGDGDNCLIMGTVDSYGHLIVSRLDVVGSDVDRLSYSVLPRDCGVGEGSWAGVCFSPMHWSTAAVARSFSKSIDVYDQDIHLRTLRTWAALSRWVNCSKYEITGLSFSSVDPAYMYVQGVDYEVICGQWKDNRKVFSFRGDSNWLGFSKCADIDVLAGWCESGSIFVSDVFRDSINI